MYDVSTAYAPGDVTGRNLRVSCREGTLSLNLKFGVRNLTDRDEWYQNRLSFPPSPVPSSRGPRSDVCR